MDKELAVKVKQTNLLWVFSAAAVTLNVAVYLFRPGGDLLLTVVSDFLPAVCALAARRLKTANGAAAYVCRGPVCSLPIGEPKALAAEIAR